MVEEAFCELAKALMETVGCVEESTAKVTLALTAVTFNCGLGMVVVVQLPQPGTPFEVVEELVVLITVMVAEL